MRKNKLGDPTKAVGYLRTSTEDQNLGPIAQLEALQQWCQAHEIDLVAVHEEHVSGGAALDKRPALLAAVDDLKVRGAGVLLVARRCRLAREPVEAAMAERLVNAAGGTIVSADGTPSGSSPTDRFTRGMFDLVAAFERGMIRLRTKQALAVKRARGERIGGIPFGHRLAADGTSLELDPAEQDVLDYLRLLRESGLSLRAIVARLNREGVEARGSKWHLTTVYRLLQRESIGATESAA